MIKKYVLMSYYQKMALSLSIIKILRKFAVEMFDFSRGLSPEIVNELFQLREPIPYESR